MQLRVSAAINCCNQSCLRSWYFFSLQDGGSLDLIMKAGRIPVQMIASITSSVRLSCYRAGIESSITGFERIEVSPREA